MLFTCLENKTNNLRLLSKGGLHKNLLSWTNIWKNKFVKSGAIRACVPTWSTYQCACMPAWFMCQRACVPKCQKRANVSFLSSNLPYSVPMF